MNVLAVQLLGGRFLEQRLHVPARDVEQDGERVDLVAARGDEVDRLLLALRESSERRARAAERGARFHYKTRRHGITVNR